MEAQRSVNNRGRRVCDIIIGVVATAMVIYQLVSPHYYLLPPLRHQNVHLGFALVLVFMLFTRESRFWWFDLGIVLISAFCIGYVQISADWLEGNIGSPYPAISVLIVGALLGVIVIMGTWRSFGPVLPIVFIIFILYAFFGYLVPGYFQAPYTAPTRLLSRMTIGAFGMLGIYGRILGVSANEIFLFMVFGPILMATGGARFFEQVGRLAGRKLAGGPAMTSVISSALVGMITGSVAANIATTGSFTIPLMKKVGYRPEQAGAIEATASTGGQIMPPVMGVAIFLMVAFTGIPYAQMMGICALPAILWFFSIGLYVQFQALRLNIKAKEELEASTREMITYGPLFFIPLIFLIVLIVMGFSLAYTVSFAIVLLIILSFIRKETRPTLSRLLAGIKQGARAGSEVAISCAGISLVLAALNTTLMPLKFPAFVEMASGGNLYAAILLTVVVGIVIGMGVSVTPSYVLLALVCAPVLVAMGLTVLQANFFVLLIAALSYLTPPVAIGAMIAAKIARANYIKTALQATIAGAGGFMLPLLIIWCPVLILRPDEPIWAVVSFIGAFVSVTALQIAAANHYLTSINRLERVIFAGIVVMLLFSFAVRLYWLAATGIILFMLVTFWQWQKGKRVKRALEVISYSSSPNG